MSMIKKIYILFLASILIACSDNEAVTYTDTEIDVIVSDDYDIISKNDETITFKNLSTGVCESFNSTDNIKLLDGLYDCEYSAKVKYIVKNDDKEEQEVETTLTGSAQGLKVTGGKVKLEIPAYIVFDKDDFIFEEIFFSGTLRPSGSQYYGTSYFKIFNNTDHVLYADGLAFCESKFKSTQFFDYTPDIREDTMTIWSIYVIPGTGYDHPVMPGHSLLICDNAIDHRDANSNAFDLSNADFEWYDESKVASVLDIDNPDIPNMDKWYCYTNSIYILHNRGFTSYALARIPVDKDTYLKDYWYTYEYVMYLTAGTFYMSQSAYKLPNSWIVDGVNCSVESERTWNILPPSVDAGWTHCGTKDHDETRYFKSIRRKMLYLNEDGTMHLQDTNNSTNDFNTECVPSIIEEQKAAIDVQGTPATTLTYDGIVPKSEN
ncbi:MAG: DUF4876 domain-containing protein [Bacteroidaceae bacterium]|nr:DUF4876 domain-containing protein [Bacteroidaceae bacterium]